MPIYEYRCKNGHTLEVMQRMSDDPLASCTTCEASVKRVFHPVAVHFKGSGFYNTDYGKRSAAGDESKAKAEESKAKGEDKPKDSSSKDKSDSSSSSSKDATPPKATADSKS